MLSWPLHSNSNVYLLNSVKIYIIMLWVFFFLYIAVSTLTFRNKSYNPPIKKNEAVLLRVVNDVPISL